MFCLLCSVCLHLVLAIGERNLSLGAVAAPELHLGGGIRDLRKNKNSGAMADMCVKQRSAFRGHADAAGAQTNQPTTPYVHACSPPERMDYSSSTPCTHRSNVGARTALHSMHTGVDHYALPSLTTQHSPYDRHASFGCHTTANHGCGALASAEKIQATYTPTPARVKWDVRAFGHTKAMWRQRDKWAHLQQLRIFFAVGQPAVALLEEVSRPDDWS